MENESEEKFKNLYRILDVTQYFFGRLFLSRPAKDLLTKIEESCIIQGHSFPFFNYFVEEEKEEQENLLITYESIKNKKMSYATGIFLGYNLIKNILWRYGYFAYFFYHTRMMSVLIYFITLWLIHKNNRANLINDNLLRYKQKTRSFKEAKDRVDIILMRDKLINKGLNNNNNI